MNLKTPYDEWLKYSVFVCTHESGHYLHSIKQPGFYASGALENGGLREKIAEFSALIFLSRLENFESYLSMETQGIRGQVRDFYKRLSGVDEAKGGLETYV